ncbi:hypothetical protein BC834DRAFT_38721 [Gloeopeniophorella convolvens]|nr:hypothetical protein BC834DRAFT_38721 [Gloeopeniophorella convolvens]
MRPLSVERRIQVREGKHAPENRPPPATYSSMRAASLRAAGASAASVGPAPNKACARRQCGGAGWPARGVMEAFENADIRETVTRRDKQVHRAADAGSCAGLAGARRAAGACASRGGALRKREVRKLAGSTPSRHRIASLRTPPHLHLPYAVPLIVRHIWAVKRGDGHTPPRANCTLDLSRSRCRCRKAKQAVFCRALCDVRGTLKNPERNRIIEKAFASGATRRDDVAPAPAVRKPSPLNGAKGSKACLPGANTQAADGPQPQGRVQS